MSKFRINERVKCVETGNAGVIKARDVVHDGNRTEVKYLVDFGGGIDNWKIVKKKDIAKFERKTNEPNYIYHEFKLKDGKSIMFAGLVTPKHFEVGNDLMLDNYIKKGKKLNIGFSIYNGSDLYSQEVGKKYARHRCKHKAFASMESSFGGEFNHDTVVAIMAAKAKYIEEHIEEFYRPR